MQRTTGGTRRPAREAERSAAAATAKVVVLGTGGTIAGRAASAVDNVGYVAAQTGVDELVGRLGPLPVALESEQVAQLDSQDMAFEVWQRLAGRIEHHLARPEVRGVVVTHGTDTLEETAYFLQRVLAPAKPVVLTGAMRPATSLQADGPQNLRDAITVAALPEARGVLVVAAGALHAGHAVRKVHPYRVDAFSSGDAGPIGRLEEGRLLRLRGWPAGDALGREAIGRDPSNWPWVEILTSAAGADGAAVGALQAAGVRGLVVAATGNGGVHRALAIALERAAAAGVGVLRATRCLDGRIVAGRGGASGAFPSAEGLTPVQARVELILRLLAADAAAAGRATERAAWTLPTVGPA
jgi:L-asparaginase